MRDMAVTSDGNVCMITTKADPSVGGTLKPFIVKFSPSTQSVLLSKLYSFDEVGSSSLQLAALPNGDIIFTGDQLNYGDYYNYKPFIARVDSSGAIVWGRRLG